MLMAKPLYDRCSREPLQAKACALLCASQVYLTPSDLGWEPFVRTWLSGLPDELYGEKALPALSLECPGALSWLLLFLS